MIKLNNKEKNLWDVCANNTLTSAPYNDEDWIVISNPGYITSMTIRYDEILFTSKNLI